MYMCTCKRSVLGSISTCTCVLVTIVGSINYMYMYTCICYCSLVGSICTYTCVLDNATEESSRFHSTCTCTRVFVIDEKSSRFHMYIYMCT